MIKLLLISIMALTLAACNGLEGVFTANQQLSFNSGDSKTDIRKGKYNAELQYKTDSRKMIINLKNYNENGSNKSIKIKIPAGVDFPLENGQVFVQAEDINQAYDLDGKVTTVTTTSERVHDWQRCTYPSYVHVCHRGPDGRVYCHNETIWRDGMQEVWYHVVYTQKDVDVTFVEPSSGASVATFIAHNKDARRVIEHTTMCR